MMDYCRWFNYDDKTLVKSCDESIGSTFMNHDKIVYLYCFKCGKKVIYDALETPFEKRYKNANR